MNLSETLKALRSEHGFTQTRIAEYFSKNGMKISSKLVSSWETGRNTPDAMQLLMLCRMYGVRDVLSVFLGLAPETAMDRLNRAGRERALEYVEMLAQNRNYTNHPILLETRKRQLPLYDISVSAGTGQFLDSDSYTLIDVSDNVPLDATYALRVSGDSMQPGIQDGQIIYVKQQQTLENGEIGIFLLNNDAYCKKWLNGKLVSLNTHYAPIAIGDYDEFRIYGKVVG